MKIAPTSPDSPASGMAGTAALVSEVVPAYTSMFPGVGPRDVSTLALMTCNHYGESSVVPIAHGRLSALSREEPHATPHLPGFPHAQVRASDASQVLILTYKPQGVQCPHSRTTVFPGITDKPV